MRVCAVNPIIDRLIIKLGRNVDDNNFQKNDRHDDEDGEDDDDDDDSEKDDDENNKTFLMIRKWCVENDYQKQQKSVEAAHGWEWDSWWTSRWWLRALKSNYFLYHPAVFRERGEEVVFTHV